MANSLAYSLAFILLITATIIIHYTIPTDAQSQAKIKSRVNELRNNATKIPIPLRNSHLEIKYCSNTNETGNVKGVCEPGASITGTGSPCPRYCLAPHTVQAGDPCDPYLFRFARRKYDDFQNENKKWREKILGTNFLDNDADYKYKGACRFLCPRVMCMDVEELVEPLGKRQFVDLVRHDCVKDHPLDAYSGVCTCGYMWSLVDPSNSGKTYDNVSKLVRYAGTVGLNRRLAWDDKYKRCGAQRYGHCSLKWPTNYQNDDIMTYCLEENHKCVNRTANYLGVAYRPFQTAQLKLWYGICDSEVYIQDPFAGQERVMLSGWVILLLPVTAYFMST